MSEEKKNFLWKLGHIPDVYLYATLIVLLVAAMFGLPKPPPETISPYVKAAYDEIEKLKPGDIVLFECRNDYAWYVTHIPGAIGMLKKAIDHKARIIEFETAPEGSLIFNYVILPVIKPRMDRMGYVYGKDWVKLGYLSGGDAAYATLVDNPENVGTDVYGTPIRQLPVFEGFRDGSNVKLIIWTGWSIYGPIRQIVSKYNTPMVAASHSLGLSLFYVYLQTGQLKGFIHGWEGGQEFEYLIGEPALGIFGAMSISMGFYLMVIGIIIANVAYLGQRLGGGKK